MNSAISCAIFQMLFYTTSHFDLTYSRPYEKMDLKRHVMIEEHFSTGESHHFANTSERG